MADGIKDAVQNILNVSYNLYNDNSEIYSAISRLSSLIQSTAEPGEQVKEKVIGKTTTGPLTPILGGTPHTASKSPDEEEKQIRVLEMAPTGKKLKTEEEPTKVLASVLNEPATKGGELSEKELQKLASLPMLGKLKKEEDEESEAMSMVAQPVIAKEEKKNTEEELNKEEEKLKKVEQTALSPPKSLAPLKTATSQEQPTLLTNINLEETDSKNPLVNMLKLIKARKSINLSDLAHELGYDKSLVERWAKVLSVSDLIKIKYPLVGEMILEA